MNKLYVAMFLTGLLLFACSSPDTTTTAPLTTDTPRTNVTPVDTGVAKAMDSTINSPEKRPDK